MLAVCPTCGACFFEGQLYWSGTGKRDDHRDLESLVCRPYGDGACINPARDATGGDTWEERMRFIDNFLDEML